LGLGSEGGADDVGLQVNGKADPCENADNKNITSYLCLAKLFIKLKLMIGLKIEQQVWRKFMQ
jgi:hypothetical protein